jgi:soluble P-type ATPase
MIEINIPGFAPVRLRHFVSDYNGTLALDGKLLPGVAEALTALAAHLELHVITADTFGLAAGQLAGLPVTLKITPLESQADAKLEFVRQLGASEVVALGNGRNDRLMLDAAAVGIGLIQREGGATQALAAADLVSTNILDALDLLLNPKRLVATLRS